MRLSRLARHAVSHLARDAREKVFRRTGLDVARPSYVQFVLTERCNYRCEYCSHWRMEEYSDEMSVSEWMSAVLSLKEIINPLAIDFTGGEPTIYPGFLDLVEFCHANRVDWFMTTNGSALLRRGFVQRLVAASPIKVDISVDSSSGAIHDLARGVPGSLARIEQGLQALISERERAGTFFPVRIKVTVHKMNAAGLSSMVEWAKNVGATSVDFNPVGGLWREEQIERLAIRSTDDREILQEEIAKLTRLKRQGHPIETSVESLHNMAQHFSGELSFGRAPCRDPVRNVIVNPRGNVRSCGCFTFLGSLRESTASQIWHGETAKAARRKSLDCSLQVAISSGRSSCMARKSVWDDVRRALLLLGFGAKRA